MSQSNAIFAPFTISGRNEEYRDYGWYWAVLLVPQASGLIDVYLSRPIGADIVRGYQTITACFMNNFADSGVASMSQEELSKFYFGREWGIEQWASKILLPTVDRDALLPKIQDIFSHLAQTVSGYDNDEEVYPISAEQFGLAVAQVHQAAVPAEPEVKTYGKDIELLPGANAWYTHFSIPGPMTVSFKDGVNVGLVWSLLVVPIEGEDSVSLYLSRPRADIGYLMQPITDACIISSVDGNGVGSMPYEELGKYFFGRRYGVRDKCHHVQLETTDASALYDHMHQLLDWLDKNVQEEEEDENLYQPPHALFA